MMQKHQQPAVMWPPCRIVCIRYGYEDHHFRILLMLSIKKRMTRWLQPVLTQRIPGSAYRDSYYRECSVRLNMHVTAKTKEPIGDLLAFDDQNRVPGIYARRTIYLYRQLNMQYKDYWVCQFIMCILRILVLRVVKIAVKQHIILIQIINILQFTSNGTVRTLLPPAEFLTSDRPNRFKIRYERGTITTSYKIDYKLII